MSGMAVGVGLDCRVSRVRMIEKRSWFDQLRRILQRVLRKDEAFQFGDHFPNLLALSANLHDEGLEQAPRGEGLLFQHS